jgi:hypothetical protein
MYLVEVPAIPIFEAEFLVLMHCYQQIQLRRRKIDKYNLKGRD